MSAAAGAGRLGRPDGLVNLRGLAVWLGFAVMAGAAAAMGLSAAIVPAPAPLLSGPLGGPFALQAPDGATVTDQSLKGAPFVMVFGYTRCGPPCDQRLAKLAGWRRSLGPRGEGLRIVLVSVDPAHDTPQRTGAFAGRIDPEILGLTGSAPAIAEVTRAYNAVHFAAPLCGGDYTIIHSGAAFVMGADGRAKAIIREGEAASSALAKLTQAVSA